MLNQITAKQKSELIDLLLGHGYTRTKAKQLLKHGAVTLNGKLVGRHDITVLPGDVLGIGNKGPIATTPKFDITLVYEDEAIVVINKPAGLLSIATEKEKIRTAYYELNRFLRERNPGTRERIFIVHRLDMDTSGLLVFAKNERAKRKLQDNWKKVEKRYRAIVEGVPEKKEDEIVSYLNETGTLKVYSGRHSERSRLSATEYRVLKWNRDYALLDIVLKTGRKNQIRVHLSEAGHPIAGDRKYGAKTDPFGRLGLHACSLSFSHPDTGRPLSFESKMPDRFGKILKQMK